MIQVTSSDIALEQRDLLADSESISSRLAAFSTRRPSRTVSPPPLDHADTSSAEIPAIEATELNANILRRSLLDHGSLIVRGLLPAGVTATLRNAIDLIQATSNPRKPRTDEWYSPPEMLAKVIPEADLAYSRHFHYDCGSVMAVESPRVAEQLLKLYEQLGLKELIREYLGEEPCLSAKKWVMRKSRLPISEAGWHQDGAFMGTDINSINLWIPLTRCGGDTGAPGMDVIPRRLNTIASADGAEYDWAVSPDTIGENYMGCASVSPEFDAGDAFFFDHFFLHRTQFGKEFTRTRYAIETWFFGSESFPKNQVPLAW